MSNQKKNFLKKLALLTVTILLNKETFAVIRDYNEASPSGYHIVITLPSSSVVPVSQPTMRPAIDPKLIDMERNYSYLKEKHFRAKIEDEESAEFTKIRNAAKNQNLLRVTNIEKGLQGIKKYMIEDFKKKRIQEGEERLIKKHMEFVNKNSVEGLDFFKAEHNKIAKELNKHERESYWASAEAATKRFSRERARRPIYNMTLPLFEPYEEYEKRRIIREKAQTEIQNLQPVLMEEASSK